MPTSSRAGIPYPAENIDPWYAQFVAMVETLDASIFATREDRNCVLTGGGTLSWTVGIGGEGTFVFSDDLKIFSSPTGYIWNVAAGTYSLSDGYILYANVSRAPTSIITVTPLVGTQTPNTDSSLLIAVRIGDRLCLRNGFILQSGFSGSLVTGSGGSGSGYWTASSSDIYNNNSGNVGVGTVAPHFKLDVGGHARIQGSNKLYFGGTGTSDNDVNIYRGGVNILQTDDSFVANPGNIPTDAVSLLINQPGSAGARDSHNFIQRGTSYDTGGHNADWKAFVNVTSNAGASTWKLQSRVDSGSFTDRFSVSDAGAVSLNSLIFSDSSVMSTSVPAGVTNGYVPIWNSSTSKWVPGPGIDSQYYLQAISIPFTYADVGYAPPVEYVAFTSGNNDISSVANVWSWNGASWDSLALNLALGTSSARTLTTLWGYTSSELWAVIAGYGNPTGGLVYKRTSGVWGAISTLNGITVNYTGKQAYNQSLHGSSASNIWCAGNANGGTNAILKWNGSAFVGAGDSNITGYISCVHVISATDVWASEQDSAKVYHYNGSAWTAHTDMVESGAVVSGISASESNFVAFSVYRSGTWCKCYTWNGSAFTDITPASWEDPARARFYAVKAFSSSEVWVGGSSLNYDYRYAIWNGSTWTNYTYTGAQALNGISALVNTDIAVSAYEPYDYGGSNYWGSAQWGGSSWTKRPLATTLNTFPNDNRYPTVKLLGSSLPPLESDTIIPTNALALRYHTIIDTPFVGTSPDIEVSVGGVQLVAPGECKMTVAKHYYGFEPKTITSGNPVTVTLTGSASAGSGRVVVEYLVPRS